MDLRGQHEDATEVNEWIKFGMRIAVSSTLHPFEYAKVLIQVLLVALIAATVMISEAKPIDETIAGAGEALKPQDQTEILKILLLKKLLLLG